VSFAGGGSTSPQSIQDDRPVGPDRKAVVILRVTMAALAGDPCADCQLFPAVWADCERAVSRVAVDRGRRDQFDPLGRMGRYDRAPQVRGAGARVLASRQAGYRIAVRQGRATFPSTGEHAWLGDARDRFCAIAGEGTVFGPACARPASSESAPSLAVDGFLRARELLLWDSRPREPHSMTTCTRIRARERVFPHART